MIRLRIKLTGIGWIEIEGDETHNVIAQAAFWGDLPAECPFCRSAVRLQHRQPKGFEYFGMVCSGTVQHECNFGQKKGTGELYYKGPGSWRISPGGTCEEENGGGGT